MSHDEKKLEEEFISASIRGDLVAISRLINRRVDLWVKDAYRKTAFMNAAEQYKEPAILHKLIDAGALTGLTKKEIAIAHAEVAGLKNKPFWERWAWARDLDEKAAAVRAEKERMGRVISNVYSEEDIQKLYEADENPQVIEAARNEILNNLNRRKKEYLTEIKSLIEKRKEIENEIQKYKKQDKRTVASQGFSKIQSSQQKQEQNVRD